MIKIFRIWDFQKKKIRFFEAEISEEPALAARCGADIVPAFLFARDGRIRGFMKGAVGEETLEKRIRELL